MSHPSDNWNPNTAGPDCDWCGECEWCNNLGRDLTVEDSSDVTVSVKADLQHLCPHVEEIDFGTVTITWRVNGQTYEMHSLAEYLRGFKDSRLSHEQITDCIRHDLSTVDGIELVSVETTWDTAGMEVRCYTSPTPVDLP